MEQRDEIITAIENAEEMLKRQAIEGLLPFTLYTYPDYQVDWFHKELCEKLDLWIDKKIKRLMVFMPPRHGKSELGSRRTPALIFGKYPTRNVIATSYSDDLASDMNRDVQRIIDDEPYKRLFPETMLNSKNIKTSARGNWLRNASLFEIVEHGGRYRSAGVGTGITGMGAGYLIIDDPFKDNTEADSPTIRKKIFDWYMSTSKTRLEKDGSVLLILTRWHEADLAGQLLDLAKANPEADQWDVLSFEAIKDTTLNPVDPREMGEALWPSHFPIENLKSTRAGMPPRFWNALYQQRPSALQGNIINRGDVNFYGGPTGIPLPDKFKTSCHSWDFAFKKTSTSDYVVGTFWGQDGPNFYLVDRVRARMGFADSLKSVQNFAIRYPVHGAILIEAKANGEAIIEVLKKVLKKIIPIMPKESKVARFEAVSPLFAAGNIWLPHPSIAPWVDEFLDELCTFPNGAHDDQVDSTSQALNWLDKKGRHSMFKLAQM